ncbi:MAG: MmgE/PrpD family protein [Deltaproteobacteria bacterium]|nr:MmgE/PrpD family protein [Deltaproteobacteria bacterium]
MESLTESVARFVESVDAESLPAEAREAAKLHILDTLGVLCAGSREEAASVVRSYLRSVGGTAEATLLPEGLRTSAPYAALGNGILAHALDYDDYEWPSMAHPSAVVLPAVLAVGERTRASGDACLAAYLVGLEVIAGVGATVASAHYERGWHSTGTLGAFGAAAACAKLLGVDSERTRAALGIAASTASGLRGNFGTMTKPFHAGHASRNGVEAATLASLGFTADAAILERELGFCALFGGEGGPDTGKIGRLGNPFAIVEPGIGVKPYPSCAATHAVLDGVFRLLAAHEPDPEEIERVECGIFYLYPRMLIHAEPRTGLEGKFSHEFCVALALVRGRVGLSEFSDENAGDPSIRAAGRKVKKYVTEEVGRAGTTYPGAVVTLVLRDGRRLTERVGARKGSPANPLSRDEIASKFLANATPELGGERAREVLERTLALERLGDVRELVRAFPAA